MKILVTGSQGFVGKNLIVELRNRGYNNILEYTRDTEEYLLDEYTNDCEFVYHLAGVNRPEHEKEFMEDNFGFTSLLLKKLEENNNNSPVLITSSIHAVKDDFYGRSKKAGEELVFEHEKVTGAKALVYRLSNLFGKWSRPNYNSVVSTFCYRIARGLEIEINNSEVQLELTYIDDVVNEFISAMENNVKKEDRYCSVENVHNIKLGTLAELIKGFKDSRVNLSIPNMKNELTKQLYSTYLSYLPKDKFSYPLKMNIDDRGSFTEFIRTPERGQVSVNISKPGITKGNHWHHTKNEKFLVVNGQGLIRFRKVDSNEVIEYRVNGDRLEVVDIPIGYTHSIVNIGEKDMVTIMWANESFDPKNPDTYFMEV